MTGNAALLIDLENFFLARESNARSNGPDDEFDFVEDLEDLNRLADQFARPRRVRLRRAYADFNVRRRSNSESRWDFYLRACPTALMDTGIEPVQVFGFPGGSNRTASDLRLAMDAIAMASGPSAFDMVVLVTGDADLIPVINELNVRGVPVAVIGVAGQTKPVYQRFCETFEFFEDLRAADGIAGDSGEIETVKHALHRILERRRPIVFAGVKPLLSRELGRAFDPTRFDCETTSEFVRRFQSELGVVVSQGDHDWRVDLPGERTAIVTPQPRAARHTAYEYRFLLRKQNPRVHVAPIRDWLRVTQLFFERAGGDEDVRPTVVQVDLSDEIIEQCFDEGMDAADKKVQATVFQLFKSGSFECAEDGAEGVTDFHWSKPARLSEAIEDVEDLRDAARTYIATILIGRLRREFGPTDPDPAAFAELLEGPEPSAERVESMRQLLARIVEDRAQAVRTAD